MNNINFQPIPKRFMVWDKRIKCFLEHPKDICNDGSAYKSTEDFDKNGWTELFDITNLIMMGMVQADKTLPDKIICQSTNLFDKDGNEIFEGSIVEWKDKVWLVFFHARYGEFNLRSFDGNAKFDSDHLAGMSDKQQPYIKIIGHILSNPELLELKNV